ncbi:MAG TPA: NHLP bacteriocin system secretion protein [Prochlorococcaceae cyanobacterium Fu_MAG_50]|nr:NHLP bacteriocin system secretion protein [Prochlorococcaceae cyanobacterium Fu_MAG_50]
MSIPFVEKLRLRWQALSDHQQVGCAQAGVGVLFLAWLVFWPVPTEVKGKGVLIYPDNAGLLNARAGGQVLNVQVAVGDRVRRSQVLMTLYLPVLERQLEQQKGNLAQLIRQNDELNHRDGLRLDTARLALDTTLAKLVDDQSRLAALQATYRKKVSNLDWLAAREVVAPLSQEVVGAEQGLTTTSVNLDDVKIQRKTAITDFQQIKLDIETEQLDRRYQIDDLKRQVRVTEARIAYDGRIIAERDGRVLDLQVIAGQTVKMGDRLGTLGKAESPDSADGELMAVAYFSPADARRLPPALSVEVVPLWNQRGRFGGIIGKVKRVLTLPATASDISTTIGNQQLAEELVKNGPVMRAEISLDRMPRSDDGYRWTLSSGSGVFPIREGLTVSSHAYVEWRPSVTYIIPGLRSLTGGYRSLRLDRLWDLPFLRQPGTPP